MVNRRDFLKASMMATAGVVVSSGLTACATDKTSASGGAFKTGPLKAEDRGFLHGVKSGDPLRDKLIIWTRITPLDKNGKEIDIHNDAGTDPNTYPKPLHIIFEVATDAKFQNLVNRGETWAKAESDYTVKIDATYLNADTRYYYRFISGGAYSPVGRAKTLALYETTPKQVKFAVFSCANYPNGFFNAYDAASKIEDLDAALHLGDYIYEYGKYKDDDFNKKIPGYANKNAKKIGRELPDNNNRECIKLADYRRRYKLYSSDSGSQELHSKVPMIVVWDDHEVCDDTYRDGAANHNPEKGEGDYSERVRQALQAYYEWLPIRPVDPYASYDQPPYPDNPRKIYREFNFGNLVSLYMLETRLTARTKQSGMMGVLLGTAKAGLKNANNKLLGDEQRQWLENKIKRSEAKWQVLGQQVLMGRMQLPVDLLYLAQKLKIVIDVPTIKGYIEDITGSVYSDSYNLKPATKNLFNNMLATFEEMARDKTIIKANPSATIDSRLWRAMQDPTPYNPDAWDGYWHERENILKAFLKRAEDLSKTNASKTTNLVVLAGDTHNAWASDLYLDDTKKTPVGVEFACSSVSSPGMEEYLGYLGRQGKMGVVEDSIKKLCDGLRYCNLTDRGFMEVTFTEKEVTSRWHFLNTTGSEDYQIKKDIGHTISVKAGERKIPQQDWEKEWEKEIDKLRGN